MTWDMNVLGITAEHPIRHLTWIIRQEDVLEEYPVSKGKGIPEVEEARRKLESVIDMMH